LQPFFFKVSSFSNIPVDLTSTTNFVFLLFSEIFLAIKRPILSANISFPLLSTTPTLSPSPSKPNPTSALFSFTHLAI